jgi:hypothetical protein
VLTFRNGENNAREQAANATLYGQLWNIETGLLELEQVPYGQIRVVIDALYPAGVGIIQDGFAAFVDISDTSYRHVIILSAVSPAVATTMKKVTKKFTMPCWSLPELHAARCILCEDLTSQLIADFKLGYTSETGNVEKRVLSTATQILEERYEIFGGRARGVLDKDPAENVDTIKASFTMVSPGGLNDKDEMTRNRHNLVRLRPITPFMALCDRPTIVSKHVNLVVTELLRTHISRMTLLLDQNTFLGKICGEGVEYQRFVTSIMSPNLGELRDSDAQRREALVYQNLNSGTKGPSNAVYKLHRPKGGVIWIEDLEDLTIENGRWVSFKSGSFPAIDDMFFDENGKCATLIQSTIGVTHPINTDGLARVCAKLYKLDRDMRIFFLFIVPNHGCIRHRQPLKQSIVEKDAQKKQELTTALAKFTKGEKFFPQMRCVLKPYGFEIKDFAL